MYIICKTTRGEEIIKIYDYIINPRQALFQCELTEKQLYNLYNEFAIVTLNKQEDLLYFEGEIKVNTRRTINGRGDISCWICVESCNEICKIRCFDFTTLKSLMDVYDYKITPYSNNFTVGVKDMPNFEQFENYNFYLYDKNGHCSLCITILNVGDRIKKEFLMAQGDEKIYELEIRG